MLDVEGFILVGGKSSRMGSDKSRLLLEGRSSVEMVAEALQPAVTRIRLVGSPGDGLFEAVSDLREDWGPLAGIEAALQVAACERSLIVACDLPFVTPELFRCLLSLTHQWDAVVPIQSDSHPQPLCAAYRRATCLPAAQLAIAAGQHAPRALLDAVKTHYVRFEELSKLKGSEYFFFNVNTPENYERAKQIARLSFM